MSFTDPAPGATRGRTDQGVDYSGVRRLVAVASGVITQVYSNLSGFGMTIIERVGNQYIYYGTETSGVSSEVHPGEQVSQGQEIAGGGSGGGVEVGFWNPNTGYAVGHVPGVTPGAPTPAGQRFLSMIRGGSTGANWQPCTLTWYDPALGGTNVAGGVANPTAATASGQPYSPSANTCAAPPQYPFGTVITFKYGNRTVTCTVNDRGGAIVGSHFDLARHPAEVLGIINAGMVQAQFSVGTAGGNSSSPYGGTRPSNVANTQAVGDIFQNYINLRDQPRTAPPGPYPALSWYWAQFQQKVGSVFNASNG